MSVQENKTIVQRFLNEAWNNRDLTVLDEVMAEDHVAHDPNAPGGALHGCEAIREILQHGFAGMPDARIEIEDVIGEGDRVLVRYTVYGTHLGDLFGVPASGRQVKVATFHVCRFAGARIVEQWALKDMLGLLQQIGAIPTPEAVPAGA